MKQAIKTYKKVLCVKTTKTISSGIAHPNVKVALAFEGHGLK